MKLYKTVYNCNLFIQYDVVCPDWRHARDQAGQIEENASDIQYILQAMTGMEDRLSKIEASAGDQGIDPRLSLYLITKVSL